MTGRLRGRCGTSSKQALELIRPLAVCLPFAQIDLPVVSRWRTVAFLLRLSLRRVWWPANGRPSFNTVALLLVCPPLLARLIGQPLSSCSYRFCAVLLSASLFLRCGALTKLLTSSEFIHTRRAT